MQSIVFIIAALLFSLPRICAQGTLSANGGVPPLQDIHQAWIPENGEITIPVVVHIVYHQSRQNISDEQVHSQIRALNEAFRSQHADTVYIPAEFRPLAADTRINFRLAARDPKGLFTRGITRTNTSNSAFGLDGAIKNSALGGKDPWDPSRYLNIWVGPLEDGILGHATTPGSALSMDGIVISYKVFGTAPFTQAPYHKGRTAVHEAGHWLGLKHIWGEGPCGDDGVDDTPPQQGPTRGCPVGRLSSCPGNTAGDMFMNYMDFTDDACTNMFTKGQATLMRSQFGPGGSRASLLQAALSMELHLQPADLTRKEASIAPNPASSELRIRLRPEWLPATVTVFNQMGQPVRRLLAYQTETRISLGGLSEGIYYIRAGNFYRERFIKLN